MKRKRQNLHHQNSHHQNLLTWLTKAGTTGLSTLEFRSSVKVGGGIGTFTTIPILAGSSIAQIPQRCVLSATKAINSPFGQQCKAALQQDSRGTDEFILLLWMAVGRKDSNHPFHCYLQSLPQNSSLPISWPTQLTDSPTSLQGTNLGTSLIQYRALLYTTYPALVALIRAKAPLLIPTTYDTHDIEWAHDNYLSRRFPRRLSVEPDNSSSSSSSSNSSNSNSNSSNSSNSSSSNSNSNSSSKFYHNQHSLKFTVASTCSSLHGELGVMLPLFDLFNHSQGTDIDWTGTKNGVSFHCGHSSLGIDQGAEIFNNYGNKGNEELMMSHGFALANNLYDAHRLSLTVLRPASVGNSKTSSVAATALTALTESEESRPMEAVSVGTFCLYRSDNPDVMNGSLPQIPTALWHAVSAPFDYMRTMANSDVGDHDHDYDHDHDQDHKLDNHNGDKKEAAVSIHVEWEDVDMLLSTIKGRIRPYMQTEEHDIKMSNMLDDGDDNNNNNGDGDTKNNTKDPRIHFIAMYRDGQRRVLQHVILALEQMLNGAEEVEADNDVGVAEEN